MDPWNPWIAETHIKRVPWWQVYVAQAFSVLLIVTLVWFVASVALSEWFAEIVARWL